MRESFMSQGFLPPAQNMIPDSGLHQGANFTLPNDTQATIAKNALFLEQTKSGLLGDRDPNTGLHKGNGIIGRMQTQQANDSYIQKTEERQQELKAQRDKAILSSMENIESLSFEKKNQDIVNATGIPDADEAIKQYESVLQTMGFNNLKHFAEVYSAFNSGTIQPGTPRYTQLKNLFAKNDKFVNGAISAFDAIEAYNRRSINPLTQQDRIDLAKEGLQTGYYQNIDQALNDLKNRDEYIANDASARVLAQEKATSLHFSPSESSAPNNRIVPNRRGGNSNFLSSVSRRTFNTIEENEEIPEETTNELLPKADIQINPDLAKEYSDTFLPKSKDIGITEVTEKDKNRNIFGQTIRGRTNLMPTFVEQSKILSPIVRNDDKFKLNDYLTPLARNVQDYEARSENNSKEFLTGKVPENLNESAQLVNDVLQNIQDIRKELDIKEKDILATNNKKLISEWNLHKKEINSVLDKTEKEYKDISNKYSKVDKNFLEDSKQSNKFNQQLDSKQKEFDNRMLKGFEEGKTYEVLAEEEGYEEAPDGTFKPNAKAQAVILRAERANSIMKELKDDKDLKDFKSPSIAALTILKPILAEDSFKDIKQMFINNKNKQPALSEVLELAASGASVSTIANKWGKLFDGKGDLHFKNQKPIDFSKLAEMTREITTKFISKNKFDTTDLNYYFHLLNFVPEEYTKFIKPVTIQRRGN